MSATHSGGDQGGRQTVVLQSTTSPDVNRGKGVSKGVSSCMGVGTGLSTLSPKTMEPLEAMTRIFELSVDRSEGVQEGNLFAAISVNPLPDGLLPEAPCSVSQASLLEVLESNSISALPIPDVGIARSSGKGLTPSNNADVSLGDARVSVVGGVAKSEKWTIVLRKGKRAVNPDINPRTLFSSLVFRRGEGCGVDQEQVRVREGLTQLEVYDARKGSCLGIAHAVAPSLADHVVEASSLGKEFASCSDFGGVEGYGVECENEMPTLVNSPWSEPIFFEPINVYPPVTWKETSFMSMRPQSG